METPEVRHASQTDEETRFFHGWLIVGILFVVSLIDGGFTYTFSAFLRPLSEEFGWTRAQTSVGFSLYLLAVGLVLPFWGWLVDHIGVRRVFIYCALLDGVALLILSQVQSLTAFYILYFILGAGLAGIGPTTVGKIVSRWFVAQRGRAMGLALVGTGLGGLTLVPLAGFLIEGFTWRIAYQVLAGLSLGIMLPLVWFFLTDTPQEKGLLPLGHGAQPDEEISNQQENTPDWSFKEALKTPTFWCLGIALCGGLGAGMSFNAHLVALLQDEGFGLKAASSIGGITLGMSMGGRFFVGWASDHGHPHRLLAFSLVLQAIALGLLYYMDTFGTWILFIVVPVFGLGFGGLAVLWPVVVGYNFGLQSFGAIAGSLGTVSATTGGALGPIILGNIFDKTGSYDWALVVCIVAYLAGAIAAQLAPTPKRMENKGGIG